MLGYEVLHKVADGSAAEVFLAREESSDDRVLLEMIRPELVHDADVYGRFLDEAKGRQELNHPHLVRRRTAGCTPAGQLFVVTEPVRGDHLGALLKSQGSMGLGEMLRLLIPICDALEYLHSRGHVHGCLRPSSIYPKDLKSGVGPKLVDTGLVLFRAGVSVSPPSDVVLVEAEYLSPERIRGQRASVESDVYGVGILMFELLTGIAPFSGSTPAETRRRHCQAPIPPLPDGCERLTPILNLCLAKDPRQRFSSVAVLRSALIKLVGDATQRLKRPGQDPHVARETLAERTPGRLKPAGRAPAKDLEPGEKLGSFEIVDLLGSGSMGCVYLARHTRLGREAALKVLRPEFARDPEQVQRFFQEARAVNAINHENIVEISDFVEEPAEQGGRFYCVMEPLRGESLKQLIQTGTLTLVRTRHIALQICAALEAAHKVDVVHRDIKPDNVFITERAGTVDFVKVLDFGIAKLGAQAKVATDWSGTQPGVVVGTPTFMPPEQATADVVDCRADVYAVGGVLYYMLAGRAAFEGVTLAKLMAAVLGAPPRPLPERSLAGEAIPPELRQVILRCLEKEPSARFQSMAELKRALERAFLLPRAPQVSALAGPVPMPRPATGAAVRSRSRLGLVLFGVAAAAGLAASLSLARLRGDPRHSAQSVVVSSASPATAASPRGIQLRLRSRPTGATVFREDTGEVLGVTPLEKTFVPAGTSLRFRFSAPGYEDAARTLGLASDVTVEVSLVRKSEPNPAFRRPASKRRRSP